MVTLQLRQLIVQPGQRVHFQNVDWDEFEAILEELGDRRASRIAYAQSILEIRMPLPKHEKAKVILGYIVKILLEELDIPHESFGSSTFKRADMAAGIEPDDCFYIENVAQMVGKDRVNLAIDPPPDLAIEVDVTSKTGLDAYQALGVPELWLDRHPDLAIEVDVTSKTGLDAYQALGVPELWRFEEGHLRISILQNGQYSDTTISPHFPQLDLIQRIEETIAQAQIQPQSQALKAFRKSLTQVLF